MRTHSRKSVWALWGLPGYAAFYLSATLGRLAGEMLPIAVVLLVLGRTGSPSLASATIAAASLPSVLTGPLLGAWLDRTRHRRAALAANQVLLAGSLAGMLLLAGRSPGWVVPLLAAAGGATAPMLTGGVTSMIPLLVPAASLPRANAMEAASFSGAAVLGPALAGAVAATAGPARAVGLEAVLALAAVVAVARMPTVAPAQPDDAERRSLASTLRAGLAHLARTPVLRGVTVTSVLAYGAQGLLPLALPLLTEQLGAGRGGAGYVYAALEVGGIAGVFAAVRMAASVPPERIVHGGTALLALGTASWALVPSFPVALALAAGAGLAAGPAFAALFGVRQQWSPATLRGQIFTTAASLKVGAFALGAALAGPVVTGLGPRGAIAATAAVELLAVAAGVWSGSVGSALARASGRAGAASPPARN
jgi:predicted MFS family arabinose efflux permease